MPASHVAGGHHSLGGEQVLVAEHAVVDGESRPLQPVDLGHDADAHHHQVRLQGGAVGQVHQQGGGLPGMRGQPLHPDAGPERHAGRPVQPGTGLPHDLAQYPAERRGERFHHRDPGSEPVAGGGHLRADEPGPDDHKTRPAIERLELGPDGEAVVEGA